MSGTERERAASPPSRTWALLAIIGVFSRAVAITLELVLLFAFPDWEQRLERAGSTGIVVTFAVGAVGVSTLLTLLFSTVSFLGWLYYAVRRAHTYGIPHPNVTPGGAIVCWFIPFINVVRPYTVVRSLYDVTRAHVPEPPDTWLDRRAKQLLVAWWCSWLLGTALTDLAIRWSDRSTGASVGWLGVVGVPLLLVAAALVASIVWRIQRNQEAVAAAALAAENAYAHFQAPVASAR